MGDPPTVPKSSRQHRLSARSVEKSKDDLDQNASIAILSI